MSCLVSCLVDFVYHTESIPLLTLSVRCLVVSLLRLKEETRLGEFCVQFLCFAQTEQARLRAYIVLAILFKHCDVQHTTPLKKLFDVSSGPIPLQIFNRILQDKTPTPELMAKKASVLFFSLLHQYPGLYLQLEAPRHFYTVYITKTLTLIHTHLTSSTLVLLIDLFSSSTTTDDLSTLQATLAQHHTSSFLPLLSNQSLLLRSKALFLVSLIVKKGLTNPLDLISPLISLLYDSFPLNVSTSLSLLLLLNEKHTSHCFLFC